jgi:4-diphosphocytidyl-2-C-methyl-D-erythritol kinase
VADRLSEAAPAKVNLYLHVTGRRADGYHLLDSLVIFAGFGDCLSAVPADTLSLELRGSFAAGLASEPDNLVLRAARSLASATGVSMGAALTLDKRLPVASGIGGGSADAAAAVRLLCRLWQLPITAELFQLAVQLGADVPVCLAGRPARMGGIGELLEEAPALPAGGLLLVNPGVTVATADVFRALHGDRSPPAVLPPGWADISAMATDLGMLRNDLQPAAVQLQPSIGAVLAALRATPGCLLARMSGSGASCFGLYVDAEAASRAAEALPEPHWWRWAGPLQQAQASDFTQPDARPMQTPDGA